jgi:hypothetical protein
MKGWRNEKWQNDNKRGGNGRWQQEAGIGVLLDFQWRTAEELMCSSIQMTQRSFIVGGWGIRASLENMAYLPLVP